VAGALRERRNVDPLECGVATMQGSHPACSASSSRMWTSHAGDAAHTTR
jgi:hypothetical protein